MIPPDGKSRLLKIAALLSRSFRVLLAEWAPCLALSAAAFAGWIAFAYADQPLLEAHGFRQTQTALTSFWMMKEGVRIPYQTPVMGYPWTIPFEFPIYQCLVSLCAAATGFGLDAVGRIVSLAFLLGCAWPAVRATRRLELPPATGWIFCALLWTSPLYVFWGRTFMIETAALFFTLVCIAFALDLLEPFPSWTSVGIVAFSGSFAMLQKATTAAPAFGVMGLILAGSAIRHHGLCRPAWKHMLMTAVAFAPPFILGSLWNYVADAAKLQNDLGATLTSAHLMKWNFGTLAQRLDPGTWRSVAWDRVWVYNVGGVLGLALILAVLASGSRRNVCTIIACLFLFALPLLIFTPLHIVHDYYQVACTAYAIAALAVACASYAPSTRWRGACSALLAVLFVVANLRHCAGSYYRGMLTWRLNPTNNTILAVADVVRRHTPEHSAIVVFGAGWSSETAYYAQRKACTVPRSFGGHDRIWDDPGRLLGGTDLGAVVYYMPEAATDVQQILRKPEIIKNPRLFKVAQAYVWIPSARFITLPGDSRHVMPIEGIVPPSLALPD